MESVLGSKKKICWETCKLVTSDAWQEDLLTDDADHIETALTDHLERLQRRRGQAFALWLRKTHNLDLWMLQQLKCLMV